MKTDKVIIRPGAFVGYMGPRWLYAGVAVNINAGVDIEQFRVDLQGRLEYHHESACSCKGYAYINNDFQQIKIPDMIVGFYAEHIGRLYDQLQDIKNMAEVKDVPGFMIKHVHDIDVSIGKLDWSLLKLLRADPDQNSGSLAEQLGVPESKIEERRAYLGSIPLGFFVGQPHPRQWIARLVDLDFVGTTYHEVLPELARIIGFDDIKQAPTFSFRVISSSPQKACSVLAPAETQKEFMEIVRRFAEVPGVKVLGYTEAEDIHMVQPWLDRFIDEQIDNSKY
jgi:hypothetical protein